MTMLLEAGGRGAVAGHTRRLRAAACRDGVPPTPARGQADESRQTLDDLLSDAWSGLLGAAAAACPVCHGEMAPRWSAGAGVVGGRCRDCGSELA
jgi:hypothetical protein